MTDRPAVQETISISDVGDLGTARLAARSMSTAIGCDERAVDEFDVASRPGAGTSIVCKRWLRLDVPPTLACPLVFGVATRPYPLMSVNGDTFVIQQWGESALVGVIDGLGHGQLAYRAAQAAR